MTEENSYTRNARELGEQLARQQAERDAQVQKAIDLAASRGAASGHDSMTRREALAMHLMKVGVPKQDIATRLLMEMGQAAPPNQQTPTRDDRQQQYEQAVGRAMEREGREPRDAVDQRVRIADYLRDKGISPEDVAKGLSRSAAEAPHVSSSLDRESPGRDAPGLGD